MASAVASSLSSIASTKATITTNRNRKAGGVSSVVRCQASEKKDEVIKRRAMVASVGVALLSMVATGAAKAIPPVPEGEPKRGTKEAIKKYANICRSMPTAAVCHG
ncbi:photosystem II 5 kDa protein, chloroplastic-like [Selaginella moellendorffii]|uniref:photosystem II 5 kDa protein, chloroplastic-like n=1 Tax=Selaginella moellendorffii TaxID=88036 RepID=UPI000D1CE7CB|nr:photosystem II 5 kDa protein, chloroplastic-like [Selaginella moellendorffii]|eukprot:XP_024539502.1 photosystem II 5 kDa protein, chloroplastic-like [Selaginella moellendorffii]